MAVSDELIDAGFAEVEEIGRGGSSVVFRARQPGIGRSVAVKVITGHGDSDNLLTRFRRESLALGALGWHPNVAGIHEVGVTRSGLPYLVMELIAGGSAGRLCRTEGGLGADRATSIMIAVGDALEAAHEAGVLHRDVKPDNIVMTADGTAKLTDFGVAAITTGAAAATTVGPVAVTVAHAAPEVLDGQRPTRASDIYSLGSTLFELLAGQPAFVDTDDDSVFRAIRRVDEEPVPDLGPTIGLATPIQLAMVRAMAKDPADRPPTARQFVDELVTARIEAGLAPIAPPPWSPDDIQPIRAGTAPVVESAHFETAEWTETERTRPGRRLALLASVATLAVTAALGLWVVNGRADNNTALEPTATPIETTVPIAAFGPPELLPQLIEAPSDLLVRDDQVWVTSSTDGLVRVFDGSTQGLIATIDTGAVSINEAGSLGDESHQLLFERAQDLAATTPYVLTLAEIDGTVWVASLADSTIVPIDPETLTPGEAQPVGTGPVDLTSTADYLFTANQFDADAQGVGTVSRFTPADGEVRRVQRVDASAFASGGAGLWFLRVDENDQGTPTGEVVIIPDPTWVQPGRGAPVGVGALADLFVDDEYVWVAGGTAGVLTRLDATEMTAETLRLDGAALVSVAPGLGYVWLADRAGDVVYQIDPATLDVVARHSVPTPGKVAVGDDAVWVTSESRNSLYRITLTG